MLFSAEFLGVTPYACTACQWLEVSNLQISGLPFLWFHAFQDFNSFSRHSGSPRLQPLFSRSSNNGFLFGFYLPLNSSKLDSALKETPSLSVELNSCASLISKIVAAKVLLFICCALVTSNNFIICPAFLAVVGGGLSLIQATPSWPEWQTHCHV